MAGKRYFETMSKVSPAGLSDAQLRIVRMTGLHAGTMAKAFRGTASPRAAIKAKCLESAVPDAICRPGSR